jgi:hypothetical protein
MSCGLSVESPGRVREGAELEREKEAWQLKRDFTISQVRQMFPTI